MMDKRLRTPTIGLLSPQDVDWGDFHCGDPRIDNKLLEQVEQTKKNLVRLYGVFDENDEVQAVISLEAGILRAPHNVIAKLGGSERILIT